MEFSGTPVDHKYLLVFRRDTTPLDHLVRCGLIQTLEISRGHSGGDTPGHIPNPEVKPSCADGTAGVTRWESRSPRDPYYVQAAPHVWGGFNVFT